MKRFTIILLALTLSLAALACTAQQPAADDPIDDAPLADVMAAII